MRESNQAAAREASDDSPTFQMSRRSMIRGGIGAAGLSMLPIGSSVASAAAFPKPIKPPVASQTSSQGTRFVAVYPLPDTRTASPGTEITFRGATADELGPITITGSASGAHSGFFVPHADGGGASFVLDAPLRAKETVTVTAGLPLGTTGSETYTFNVVQPVSPRKVPTERERETSGGEPRSFRSRPDLKPYPIEVTDSEPGTEAGLIFTGPRSPDGQTGPMIIDDAGEPIWFLPLDGEVIQALDVRVQEYLGNPVLTWWEGAPDRGFGFGHFVIRDTAYQEIAAIRVGNGYAGADLHEFKLTPEGTACACIYNRVRWDMTAIGGEEEDLAMDSIIQEIEIASGRVLFEWHSLDHVGLEESKVPVPSEEHDTYDYFHMNSVEPDPDGNFVVSARNTWGIYKVDRLTGELIWRLGGTQPSFEMGEGTAPAWQHDARVHPDGQLSLFDNASNDPEAGVPSRGLLLDLDLDAMTTTLVQEFVHPTKIVSSSQGSCQMLPNGNAFVGWGSAPVFSEFDPDGTLKFNGRFPEFVTTYRAYRFPWVGQPSDSPVIAADLASDDKVTIYASWNGATEVATWRVLAGSEPDQLEEVDSAPREGFETTITVETSEPFVAVQALDSSGNALGVSEAIEASS